MLDLGAILYFVSPYRAVNFGISPETLSVSFSISTLVSDLLITRWVYRNQPIKFPRKSLQQIVELEMVDFNIILGMIDHIPVMSQSMVELESFDFSS